MAKCDLCGAEIQTFIALVQGIACKSCYANIQAQRKQTKSVCNCTDCGVLITGQVSNFNSGLCNTCYLNAVAQQAKSQAHQRVQQAYYRAQKGGQKVAYNKRTGPVSNYAQAGTSTSTQEQCSFIWDVPRGAYAITSQFQQNFLEFIKAKVPVSDRAPEYDSVTRKFKCWYIKEAWFDVLYELATQLWGANAVRTVTRADAERAWKAQEDARNAAIQAQRAAVLGPFESALLDFCSLCDVDALRAARNKMAIILHPDKHGDPDKMAKLNASWFIVETELKKRSEGK